MYEIAKKARAGMKSKAERLAGEKDRKTDSSDWSPAEPLNADVKTGMRPVSRRAYKSGGKVAGCATPTRADRKPRKAGGRVEQKGEQPLVDRYINRDLKKANEYRDGTKHVGALKHGGRAKKADGGYMSMEEMIRKNPAPAKKPLGLDKIPLPPRRPTNLTTAVPNAKPDETKRMRGDYISPQEIGKKHGGRTGKANGGGMDIDERLRKGQEFQRKKNEDIDRRLAENKKKYPGLSPIEVAKKEMEKKFTPAYFANLKKQKDTEKSKDKGYQEFAERRAKKSDNDSDDKMKKGGRVKKQDGGGMDPRLGIVSPKALNFAQNLVTPGLKRGGRTKKEVGGPAIEAGKAATAALSNMPTVGPNPSASNVPPVSSGLLPQPKGTYEKPPAYDPDKYKSTPTSKILGKIRDYAKTPSTAKGGGRIAKAKGGSFWGSPEFKSAFRAARNAYLSGEGPKTFEFKGKSYSTDLMKVPTPPSRPRPVQEKVLSVEFGPAKAKMPEVNQMGDATGGGMKKGGRIKKQIGGALGSAAGALGRSMAPAAMGAAMRPQMPSQAMMGRPPVGANPAMMGRGPAPQAMANAQGRPFQPGGKFAAQPAPMPNQFVGNVGQLRQQRPPMMTTMPVDPINAPLPRTVGGDGMSINMDDYLAGTRNMTPTPSPYGDGMSVNMGDFLAGATPTSISQNTPVDTSQARSYGSGTLVGGNFANGGRIARASGGSAKSKGKGKTNINIIISAGKKEPPAPMQPAPMGAMPPLPPPMSMGAPPMPPAPMGGGMPPMPPMDGGQPPMPGAFKQGGRVSKVAKSYKDMTAGAGSGEGRLQKADIAKRTAHKAGGKVYRSYKDMDAGSGSGKGRLEKTEIQSRKR